MKHFQRWLWLILTAITWTLGANAATVYFDNSKSNWENVYIYCWQGGNEPTGAWPGTEVTEVYQGSILVYNLPVSNVDGLIFNAGKDKDQTGNLVLSENHVYIFTENKKSEGCEQGSINDYVTDPNPDPDPDPDPTPDPTPVPDATYWIVPANPKPSEAVTLHLNTQDTNLSDTQDIYVWTGLKTDWSNGEWKYGPTGEWANISSHGTKYKMTVDPDNSKHYTFSYTPSLYAWFGVSEGETANQLMVIFRDSSGKTKLQDADISFTLAADSPAPEPPTPSASPLGAVSSYEDIDGSVRFTCANGSLHVTPYGPETVKIFTLANGASKTEERRSISVDATPDASYSVEESDTDVRIAISGGITVAVNKETSLITFLDKLGNTMLAENKGLSNNINGGSTVSFRGMNDGAFYGGGYNGDWTDWNGHEMIMNNRQQWGWNRYDHYPRCINVPFYVSTSGYGVYFDDHYRDASIKPSSNGTTYSSGSQDPIAYYFVGGGSMEKVMENYSGLTGRQPLPPYWALGYITSRYGYHSESEASEVIDKIKNIKAPLDGLVFDLYWEGEDESGMGNLTWHTPKFPDGKQMMADFLERGVHTVVITEPFFTSRCTNYNILKDNGWLADEDVYDMSWLKSEKVGLIDASNPDAMSWMADFYEDYTRQGMSGWWLDLGEPERHDDDSRHKGGTVNQIHNEFGNLWLEAVYTRLHDKFPDMRQMLMPRSGTSGMQRFATFPWTGDIQRSWDGLQAQIPALVNSSMSGIGYMGSDTGGFAADGTDANLYLRWVEFAVFSPSMRTHSSVLPEPYNECYNSIREDVVKYINMRYSYLPYTYTLAYDNATYGIPLARPVNFYDQEPSTLGAVDNEYLWGADILVAPVVENKTERDIRFPDGRWMDLNNPANIYQGGTTVNYHAPLGTLPHFGRVGSIIPRFTQTTFTNTAEIDRSAISLDVILNPDGESHGRMYDDNRTSFDPVSTGDYLLTDITARHRDTDIDIFLTNEGNGYDGIPDTRTFLFTVHNFILPDDAKVFWGYNHPEREQAMESVIRRSAPGDDNGEIAGSNEYSTLEALTNAEGEGFVRDRDNNRTHLKVKVPALSNYVLTLGYSNVATGVETLLTTAPLTLSCHNGIFTYSAPEDLHDLRLEIYTPTGMRTEIHEGLSADGLTHQISTGCTEGLYIGLLSGRDASGAIKTATAKVLVK